MLRFILTLLSSIALVAGTAAQVQTTALDTTFGSGGIVRTDPDSTKLQDIRIAALPDGRLMMAGSYYYYLPNFDIVSELRLLRFLPDGRPDSSFNGTGVRSELTARLNKVVGLNLQSDGKILVTGSEGRIERFLPDGLPDSTYNDSAQINIGFFGPYDVLSSSALQADGKLVVCGYISQQYLLTMRFLVNGQPDATYGFNGLQTTNIDSTQSLYGAGVTIQPDGKIVLAATGNDYDSSKLTVLRFLPDGGLDPAFNGKGYRKIGYSGFPYASGEQALLQPDGKLLVSGQVYGLQVPLGKPAAYYCFARLTAAGSLDASFGSGGKIVLQDTVEITHPFNEHHRIALQPDGKWLLASTSKTGAASRRFLLSRFLNNGAPDPDFGNAGFIATDLSPEQDLPTDLLVQADGKIVVTGVSEVNDGWPQSTRSTPAMVRYRPDVTLGIQSQPGLLNAHCYPNPAGAAVQVEFSLNTAAAVRLQLTDLSGRGLQEWNFNGRAGKNDAAIALPAALSPGMYLLHLQAEKSSAIFRLNKR